MVSSLPTTFLSFLNSNIYIEFDVTKIVTYSFIIWQVNEEKKLLCAKVTELTKKSNKNYYSSVSIFFLSPFCLFLSRCTSPSFSILLVGNLLYISIQKEMDHRWNQVKMEKEGSRKGERGWGVSVVLQNKVQKVGKIKGVLHFKRSIIQCLMPYSL